MLQTKKVISMYVCDRCKRRCDVQNELIIHDNWYSAIPEKTYKICNNCFSEWSNIWEKEGLQYQKVKIIHLRWEKFLNNKKEPFVFR
jgi:hypothetical protein